MTDLQDIPIETIDGEKTTLADYDGQVRLVVNVASQCGLTPQYEGLQALHRRYRDQGFTVLGFPANDFGNQEPGTNEEIAQFCTNMFAVDFPLFAKISVKGPEQHPLYDALTAAIPAHEGDTEAMKARLQSYGLDPQEPDVLWNFEKFLVARDGTVVRRFAPSTTPEDPTVVAAIEEQLGSPA